MDAAKPIEGKITKFGMNPNGEMDGTLTIDAMQPSGATIPTVVKGSEAQRTKMFPKMTIGDTINVYVRDDGTIQGGITVKDKADKKQAFAPVGSYAGEGPRPINKYPTKQEQAILQAFAPGGSYAGEGPRPINKYPTKQEQAILDAGDKQKSIMWMAALKNATEIEKFFVGGVEDRQETTKNVLMVAYAIYGASLRVMRDLPPIEEVRGA